MCEAGSVAFGDPAVSKTATVLGVSMLWLGRPVLMKSSHQVVINYGELLEGQGSRGVRAAGSGHGHQGRVAPRNLGG